MLLWRSSSLCLALWVQLALIAQIKGQCDCGQEETCTDALAARYGTSTNFPWDTAANQVPEPCVTTTVPTTTTVATTTVATTTVTTTTVPTTTVLTTTVTTTTVTTTTVPTTTTTVTTTVVTTTTCVCTTTTTVTTTTETTTTVTTTIVDACHEGLCRVCSVSASENTATEAHRYAGTFSFGANQKGGVVDESMIQGYVWYIAHNSGNVIAGGFIAKNAVEDDCCRPDSYQVPIGDSCMHGAQSFVVCVLTNDHMLSGAPHERISDFYNGCQHIPIPEPNINVASVPTTANAEQIGSNIIVLIFGFTLLTQRM